MADNKELLQTMKDLLQYKKSVAIELQDIRKRLVALEAHQKERIQKEEDGLVTYKQPKPYYLNDDYNTTKEEQEIKPDSDEKRANKYKEMTERYASGFTIHGLNYMYTGRKTERFFWLAILVLALLMLVYGLYSLVIRFGSYEASQHRTVHHPIKIKFPIIAVCSDEVKNDYITCYKGNHEVEGMAGTVPCLNSTTIPTIRVVSCKRQPQNPVYLWLLLKFNVTIHAPDCQTVTQSILHGTCIKLNPYQTEVQTRPGHDGRLSYYMTYTEGLVDKIYHHLPRLRIFTYEANEFPTLSASMGQSIYVKNNTIYDIEIMSKIVYNRLDPPYSSGGYSCFPEKSPRTVITETKKHPCLKSCMIHKQYNTCGGLNDLWMQQVPTHHRLHFTGNKYENETRRCIQHRYMSDFLDWKQCPECPDSCKRTDYKVADIYPNKDSTSFKYHNTPNRDFNSTEFILDVWYKDLEYEMVTESPKYPWFSFVAEFGGYLGLLTGCSAISIIEVTIFIFFAILGGANSKRPARTSSNP